MPDPPDPIAQIATVAMTAQQLPALSIGIRRPNEPDVHRSYGHADLENNVPATTASVYRIGSLTKMFTAAAILRLAERGQLKLSDTVGALIPQYPEHGHRITVEQLLTHTSGIENYTELPEFAEKSRLDLTHQQLGRMFAPLPLEFEPGERFRYSNSGYYVLGVIIEIVSGVPYHEFMQREFFTPLGLRDTYYLDDYRIIKGRVRGYDTWQGMIVNAGQLSMMSPFAAGALGSTTSDLLAWGVSLLEGVAVSPSYRERMTTPATLNNGTHTTYGYGMMLGNLSGHRKWFHPGTINGFRGQLAIYPDANVVVAVLTNSGGGAAEQIETHVARAALGIDEPVVIEVALPKADVSRVAGRYEFDSGVVDVTVRDGQLTLAGTRLRPIGPDQYVLASDADTHVTFLSRSSEADVIVEREGQRSKGRRKPDS